jgi:arsenite methyltransferase
MEPSFSAEDKAKIKIGIRKKYARVADIPEGLFKYPTGRRGLEILGYDREILKGIPETVQDSYCGVGNPFSLGPVKKGEAVLDIGSGGGLDSLVAARMAGAQGKVIGLDISPEMVARANQNLKKSGASNVFFREFSREELPFPNESFDLVISNGVFNLIPDKEKMLKEACRVLKLKGRLQIVDQVLIVPSTQNRSERLESWSG